MMILTKKQNGKGNRMKYLDDLLSVRGFKDGQDLPIGIETYREVYIKILNACLKKHGSFVRVFPLKKAGLNNNMMIGLNTKSQGKIITLNDVDEEFHAALIEATGLNVDWYVEVKTVVNVKEQELEDFITEKFVTPIRGEESQRYRNFKISEAMVKHGGSFAQHLGKLFQRADSQNQAILLEGFSHLFKDYERYLDQ